MFNSSYGECGIGPTQDVTTPVSLPLNWMETIKGEPPFTVQDELTTKTCGYGARKNNILRKNVRTGI